MSLFAALEYRPHARLTGVLMPPSALVSPAVLSLLIEFEMNHPRLPLVVAIVALAVSLKVHAPPQPVPPFVPGPHPLAYAASDALSLAIITAACAACAQTPR